MSEIASIPKEKKRPANAEILIKKNVKDYFNNN
jgi:hypothetical protein